MSRRRSGHFRPWGSFPRRCPGVPKGGCEVAAGAVQGSPRRCPGLLKVFLWALAGVVLFCVLFPCNK